VVNVGAKNEAAVRCFNPSTAPLHGRHDDHSLGLSRNPIWEPNIPAPLALVHPQNDAGRAGRVIGWRIKQQKTWPQLGHWNRIAIQDQIDPNIGRVAAVTAKFKTRG